MLWFSKKLHVLKTLVKGEVSFLSNSNFDGQLEVIDTRNLVISLPIKETFSYLIKYTEQLKRKDGQEIETNSIRIKCLFIIKLDLKKISVMDQGKLYNQFVYL